MRSADRITGIRRSLSLAAGGGVILILLQCTSWIDLQRIAAAIGDSPGLILGIALTQLGIVLTTPVRHHATLRAFQLEIPFRRTITACTVSACIAPWLPGSAAAGETIRMGLLLTRRTGQDGTPQGAASPVALILAATGVDNGIRLLLDLTIGFLAGVLLLLTGIGRRSTELAGLVLILGFSCLAMAALPVLLRCCRGEWLPIPLTRLRRFVATVRDGIHPPRVLLPSLLLGLAATLLNGMGFFLAAQAVDARIEFLCILVAYPLLLVGSLFPLGLAGLGGNQLITVAVFALLGIPAQDATSAELLHTGVVLVLNGLILIAFVPRLPELFHACDPHVPHG